MDDIKFKTVTDLYRRLYPAISIKCNSINTMFKSNITEIDIWNYLKDNVWNKKKNLFLCDMVDDILNTSEDNIYFNLKK